MGDNLTAAGILGVQRSSMYDNLLLHRSPLGRSRTWCHHVPKNMVFGLESGGPENMNQFFNWSSNMQSAGSHSDDSMADYFGLNKLALSAGLTTARQFNEFRQTHDVRRYPMKKRETLKVRNLTSHPMQRTSAYDDTPIVEVIAHDYGRRWVENKLRNFEADKLQRAEKLVSRNTAHHETRSSLLRMHKAEAPEKPLWKLPTFDKAQACVNSNLKRNGSAVQLPKELGKDC